MQQQQFRQAANPLLEGRQREQTLGQRNRRAPAGRFGRPGAGTDGSKRSGRIAAIKNDVMRRLEGVEPFRGLLAGRGIEHRGSGSHFDQCTRQAVGNRFVAEALLQRNDGKGFGPRAVFGTLRRVLQPSHHHPHHVHHHAGMAGDEGLESIRADAQKLGVAQSHQLGGMRFAGDQRHFADCFAGGNMGHHPAPAMGIFDKHAKAAGHHQEQSGIVFAVAIEKHAAGKPEPIGFRQQPFASPRRRPLSAAERRRAVRADTSG